MFTTTKNFLNHFNLKNLDKLPPLATLHELEPEPELTLDDDTKVPTNLQTRTNLTIQEKNKTTAIVTGKQIGRAHV